MERPEQAVFLPTDDSHLNYDANFCSLPSDIQMPLDDGNCAAECEPSVMEQQETEINANEQQAELVGSAVTHSDNSSVLENGKGPDNTDKRYIVTPPTESGYVDKTTVADNSIGTGVCIGSIVSVHEQTNAISAKQSAAQMVQETAFFSKPENREDYGESVAMDDFGGEFEDCHGMEEAVSIFADNELNKPDTSPEVSMNDRSAEVHPAEAREDSVDPELSNMPEILNKILPKSPSDEVSPECEEPPVLEREDISADEISKQTNEGKRDDAKKSPSKTPLRKLRQRPEEETRRKQAIDVDVSPASNTELNVNSRPRRSVNRKSVFELLHVEYRHVGVPKKVGGTHCASEGEVGSHESSAKKPKGSKKRLKTSNEHAETPAKRRPSSSRDQMRDIDERINAVRTKVIGYKPDDFLDYDDMEREASKVTDDKEKNASFGVDRSSLKESLFSEADDVAARSFLSIFAAETADALSSSQRVGDGNELEAVIAENQQLRSRIKALEQSKSLVRKFNIDFHSRKFSRVRSPAIVSFNQQKTPGKIAGDALDGTPATERKAPVENGESMLTRIAMLDRRELKLRELNAELDERATLVKIAEGSLRRRERKLADFEKTLEHRERVLSRHEQGILKRELMLGSPSSFTGDLQIEDGDDRQSLAAEIQRRLEQRRLELDRRQVALNSERTRLEIRERELDRREVVDENISHKDGEGTADSAVPIGSRLLKHSTSTADKKRKTSVSHSIRSKYLSPKKQKVFVEMYTSDATVM